MRDNENKKRYLNRVAEKICNNKIKSEVAVELEAHIDERAQFYEEIGYSEEDAFEKAVEQMGDPDAVGVSLSRLHPKGKIWKTVLLLLWIFIMLCLFWITAIFTVDDSIKGTGFCETILLLSFIGISQSARKRGNVFLTVLLPLLFVLNYGWYMLIVCDVGFSHVCSSLIFSLSCLLSGDFTDLAIFPYVGGITVAPWISYLSIAFYVLIFLLLLSASVSALKLHRPTYSLFDKRASKALTVIEKTLCGAIVLVLLISQLPLETSVGKKEFTPFPRFNYVVVLQSNTPCAVEDVQAEDIWIFYPNYDWSDYVFFWDFANDWRNDTNQTSRYSIDAQPRTVSCGNKMKYKVGKVVLTCNVNKPYVAVHFVNYSYSKSQTLLSSLPQDLEWQSVENVETVSKTLTSYDTVDVMINTDS